MNDFVTVIFVVAAGIRFAVSTNFLGYNNYYRTPIYRIFFPSLRLYYMAPTRDHRSAAGRKYSVGTYRKSTEIKSFFSNRIHIYICINIAVLNQSISFCRYTVGPARVYLFLSLRYMYTLYK